MSNHSEKNEKSHASGKRNNRGVSVALNIIRKRSREAPNHADMVETGEMRRLKWYTKSGSHGIEARRGARRVHFHINMRTHFYALPHLQPAALQNITAGILFLKSDSAVLRVSYHILNNEAVIGRTSTRSARNQRERTCRSATNRCDIRYAKRSHHELFNN